MQIKNVMAPSIMKIHRQPLYPRRPFTSRVSNVQAPKTNPSEVIRLTLSNCRGQQSTEGTRQGR